AVPADAAQADRAVPASARRAAGRRADRRVRGRDARRRRDPVGGVLMRRVLLVLEPVIWALFSAGMMVGGLLLPAWALVMGVAGPLGIASTASSYDHFYVLASRPVRRLVRLPAA